MPWYANNGHLVIMAVTKAVIAVIIVASVCYCMVSGRRLEDGYLQVILLVVGAYFGVSADVYRRAVRERKEMWGLLSASLEQLAARERRSVVGGGDHG